MWKSRLFYLIGSWILVLACLQLIPLVYAAVNNEPEAFGSLSASTVVAFLIGGALFLGFRSTERVRVPRLTIFLPIVGIVCLAAMAGLPLFFLFPDSGFLTSFYDGMSQITTNGSTAYEGTIETMSSILLWRSLTSWIGGLMAVAFALSLLMAMNSGAMQLHQSPLNLGDRETGYQRLRSTTKSLLPLYIFATLLCFILLWLSGNTKFDAFILALSAVSTSGVVPETLVQGQGALPQLIMVVFLLIGLSNWDFHHFRTSTFSLGFRQDRELKTSLLTIAFGTVLLALLMDVSFADFISLVFAATSALSTYGSMPEQITSLELDSILPVTIVLMMMAAVGGAVASSSGGLKQMRILMIFRLGRAEVDRLAHPHGVHTVNYGSEVAETGDINAIWLLLGSFVLITALGAMSLAVLGIHFQDALTLAFTAMTLSGPLATSADPEFAGYASLAQIDYLILSILMLIGRIEAPIFMAIFAKALWRG